MLLYSPKCVYFIFKILSKNRGNLINCLEKYIQITAGTYIIFTKLFIKIVIVFIYAS